MDVHRSARNTGWTTTTSGTPPSKYLIAHNIDDDQPARELLDDGAELAIHGMKARPQCLDLLP